MSHAEPDTDALLARAADGDGVARHQLLARHQARLRDLVALRLDPSLRTHVDPSDVVAESLADADRKFAEYLDTRPLPFFLWLRQLALERLVALHRPHVQTPQRSATREEPGPAELPDESFLDLIDRLPGSGNSPSARLQAEERRQVLHVALLRLSARDREVLVLRHLDQLSVSETAAVLGISEGAVKVRHVKALHRLGLELTDEEEPP